MTLEPSKPAVQSKGVIGSVTSLTAVIVAYVAAKTKLPPELVDQIVTPLIVAGAGNLLAIFGRLFAKKTISGVLTS